MGDFYSEAWKPYTDDLTLPIEEAISQIQEFFGVSKINILQYNVLYIAIPVKFTVSIPPMGTVNDIDIRPKEPMIILISLLGYPNECPFVMPDRKDFPRQHLAHLYAGGNKEKPAGLCLVRNNPNEWFANKSMRDLLTVAEGWLYKAATGQLTEDANEFDPIRLESVYGYHIYKYSRLSEIVTEKAPFLPGYSFAVLLSYVYNFGYQNKERLTYRSLSVLQFIQKDSFLKHLPKLLEKLTDVSPMLSMLVWQPDDVVENDYSTELPANYGELKAFFQQRNIDIEAAINAFINSGCQLTNGIPIIYAVKRPKKLVGYNGDFEFINFAIMADEFKNGNNPNHAEVKILGHIEPFSKELVTEISGESRNAKTLFIGAGSLGSKMIIHDVRSGKLDVGVIDNDKLLQHNLGRHALFNNKVGLNKASAIIKEAKDLFESENHGGFKEYDDLIHRLPEDELERYEWVVDTTASVDVLNWLAMASLKDLSVARGEIADNGTLGLLYIEGEDRNPRIDDLVNLAYYNATDNLRLQAWRRRDAEKEINTLNVGLGCSSTTTIMADDVISFHASIFSKVLYTQAENKKSEKGLIYWSTLDNGDLISIKSEYQIVEPFNVYYCAQGSGWEVRMRHGLDEKLLHLCNTKRGIETGGVLIGMANYKTKTIHVFDIIIEPQGSVGSCNGFIRGVKGLPEEIDRIKEDTGNVVGYIGEWHTHPMNLEALSERDIQTVAELAEKNRELPIPTCAMIVTKEKILPFIFE